MYFYPEMLQLSLVFIVLRYEVPTSTMYLTDLNFDSYESADPLVSTLYLLNLFIYIFYKSTILII